MALSHELARAADAAAAFADAGERVEAVLAAEPSPGRRYYLASFTSGSWLVVGADGAPVTRREVVRDAASIAALAEVAADTAGGGDLTALRKDLAALSGDTDVGEAEAAAAALDAVIGKPPRVATPAYLDELGTATRRLELALGDGGSPFANAMAAARSAVDALAAEVEARYKVELT